MSVTITKEDRRSDAIAAFDEAVDAAQEGRYRDAMQAIRRCPTLRPQLDVVIEVLLDPDRG